MPCLLVSDSEDQSVVLQLQGVVKVQDLPNNKKSTSVPKSTLLLGTELSRKTLLSGGFTSSSDASEFESK